MTVEPFDLLIYESLPTISFTRGAAAWPFRSVPFVLVRRSMTEPPPGQVLARIQNFTLDRQRLLDGLDWLLTVQCDVVNLSIGPLGRFFAR
jgi:hypothetical protein